MTDDQLREAIRAHALLEGDFVLRSGRRSRYYLDKYRFETRPELLGELGRRIWATAREAEPEAARLAGPELGAVALAASASLASGLPFVIVRGKAKAYGTGNRLEGAFEEGGADQLARHAVRLWPLFTANQVLEGPKSPANPHG